VPDADPTPGNEPPGRPPTPPVNPYYSGKVGATSVIVTVTAGAIFALFLGLDTLQFIVTGNESQTFQAIAHGAGAIGLGGLVVTLVKSYLAPRG
jgi:hypothetical protein